MKIYTRTGDDGTTGLQGGARVSKSSDRIAAYGAVDELNAAIGLALSGTDGDVSSTLTRIQNELFSLGADLSNPDMRDDSGRIGSGLVEGLEADIDRYEEQLGQLANFILPGGAEAASRMHVARTVARRAEAAVIRLQEAQDVNAHCGRYLNRLSDLLFVLARVINKQNNIPDTVWKP